MSRGDNEKQSTPRGDVAIEDQPKIPREWRAWACLAGCFFLMFNSWGNVNATGTYLSYYKQHLLADSNDILQNLIGATQCFCVLGLSGIVGRLLDAGYSRQLLGVGGLLTFVGMLTLGFVGGDGYNEGNYGLVWLTQGFIAGCGMGCLFVSSSQICSTWFPRMKGLAICIVASGASISGLIYPVMIKELLIQVGFNNAVRYVAAVFAATLLFSFIFARPNPAWHLRKPERWTDSKVWVDKNAFKNRSYVFFTASISMLFLGFYPVFFNLEEWAASEGLGVKDRVPGGFQNIDLGEEEVAGDAIRTFYLLAVMNASSTIGRLGAAFLSDWMGALNLHIVATSVIAILVLCFWTLINNTAGAIGFVVIFGIFSGTVIGLPPASTAYILEQSGAQQSRLGQWVGMMYTAAAIPSLIGPIAAGALVQSFNDYLTVQLWAGVCFVLSALLMGLSRWFLNGEIRKRKLSEGAIVGDDVEGHPNVLRSMTMTSGTLTAVQTPRRSVDEENKDDEDETTENTNHNRRHLEAAA
ncbi:MFS general substrate transporter [Pseudovirgaria hyperparasitica]|uniref:MFS general substrate transporter n=1 Tax=Pseudovirgaria hyperparasitica TaxID=470096 RepID=A0A6A6WDE6_9PEZI|nr:MFS general substrate transporter [Pseudovirgaria hyperparasitica]KAF2760733.1 MFS general substrate transporter [Pseudovirgaria hyperparasitica]